MTDAGTQQLIVTTFAERPDLLAKVFAPEIQSAVPEFMRHDPAAALYCGDGQLDHYRDYGLVAVGPAEPDRPVARAFSVPFALRDGRRGRETLPDASGTRSFARRIRIASPAGGPPPSAPSKSWWRRGCKGVASRGSCSPRCAPMRAGWVFADLYAPLRPTDKHREPLTPFADYVVHRRPDGLPFPSDDGRQDHHQAGRLRVPKPARRREQLAIRQERVEPHAAGRCSHSPSEGGDRR